jgi:chromosome partitioning protein
MSDGPEEQDRARSIFDQLRAGGSLLGGDPTSTDPIDPTHTDPTSPPDSGPAVTGPAPDADATEPSLPAGGEGADPPVTRVSFGSTPAPAPGTPEDEDAVGAAATTSPGATPEAAAADAPLVPRIAVPPDLDEALHAATNDLPTAEQDDTEAPTDDLGRTLHPGSVSHPLPRTLAVANQKGGVGKTTTTVNLGASLAELGYRVLVIDLDPQGNATTGLGINGRNLDASVYDVILHDVPVEDVIEPTSLRNLFVVPATIDLAGAEIELVPVFSRELRLKRALETVEADFDFLLIDCPPSLGLLTVNALAAAGEVLVPIQCEYYALEGLSQLLRNVNLVKSNLNNRLEVSTIVLTMYDARTKLAEQVADEVRDHFGRRVCRNVVPRTVRLSEAPSFGQPVTTFDSSSRGAIAYRELAREVSGGAPQRVR